MPENELLWRGRSKYAPLQPTSPAQLFHPLHCPSLQAHAQTVDILVAEKSSLQQKVAGLATELEQAQGGSGAVRWPCEQVSSGMSAPPCRVPGVQPAVPAVGQDPPGGAGAGEGRTARPAGHS